jgi:alkaline phosphatase D
MGDSHKHSTRILFASCSKAYSPQPLWPQIVSRAPDVFIWGGDSIYADKLLSIDLWPSLYFNYGPLSDSDVLAMYNHQKNLPGYAALRQRNETVLLGTWDDHDYGVNDGDKTFEPKTRRQRAFLDFLGEDVNSPRRMQQGVYSSRLFNFSTDQGRSDGSALAFQDKTVLVVLLDLRWHKDVYGVKDGDFLGEAQWAWLEQTLQDSVARVHLIVSSLPLLEGRQVVLK